MQDRIGKYEILQQIGEGGFGKVFKARDPFIKRLVAVKTCSIENDELRKRFFREARIAGKFDHPNVTLVHDFGVEESTAFLVQEYLSGEDLSDKIGRRQSLPLEEKISILTQAARGLAYAHDEGVIHRDIKPGNIRVLDSGRVKLMDFGIAKLSSSSTQLTQKGMAVGTVGYLSPEQLGGGDVDGRTDIFAFGVTAYELLTYRLPFDGPDLSSVLRSILAGTYPPLSSIVPDCPVRLEEIIHGCLERDPGVRSSSFHEIADRLEALGDELESSGPHPAAATELMPMRQMFEEAMDEIVGNGEDSPLDTVEADALGDDDTIVSSSQIEASPAPPADLVPNPEAYGVEPVEFDPRDLADEVHESFEPPPVIDPEVAIEPVEADLELLGDAPPEPTEGSDGIGLETVATNAEDLIAAARELEGQPPVPALPESAEADEPPPPEPVVPPPPSGSEPPPLPTAAPAESSSGSLGSAEDLHALVGAETVVSRTDELVAAAHEEEASSPPDSDAAESPPVLPQVEPTAPPPDPELAATVISSGPLSARELLEAAKSVEPSDDPKPASTMEAPSPVVSEPAPEPTPTPPPAPPPKAPVAGVTSFLDETGAGEEPAPDAPTASESSPGEHLEDGQGPAPPPESSVARSAMPLLVVAAAMAIVALGAIGFWWFNRGSDATEIAEPTTVPVPVPAPEPPTEPAPVVTTLVPVTAEPWGEIRTVVDVDGRAASVPANLTTPNVLELEDGAYRIELAHPSADDPQWCDVTVTHGRATECHVVFEPVDVSEYFRATGWWQ